MQTEYFRASTGQYEARVLADSIAANSGVRLTTLEVRFPRFILAEVNTHRVFSRNSASSRAIPPEKLIEAVASDPFVPATFNSRIKGMGVGDVIADEDASLARSEWLEAARDARKHARRLIDIGIDKSRINRLLEPFMWHTAIITSTEWKNFYALRCPQGHEPTIDFPAQLEFQQTAILMREAMRASEPQELHAGELHLPLVTDEELAEICKVRKRGNEDEIAKLDMEWKRISARRVARVSFDKHTDTEELSVSISKTGDLINSGHFSPTEAVATPITMDHIRFPHLRKGLMVPASMAWLLANCDPDERDQAGIPLAEVWSGNLRGWFQFRKEFLYEDDHSALLDYEVM